MRIAITHPYAWPEVRRGAERITVETARALAGRGHSVTVFTAGSQPARTTAEGFLTVRFRRRCSNPLSHERWFGLRVLPALVASRFDATHSIMPYDCLAAIAASRLTGARTVYEEMGIPYRSSWLNLPDVRTRRIIAERVDVYGCMSRFAADVLRRDWRRAAAVIPGGVRLDEFQPAQRAAEPTILYSGTLNEPRKGVGLLLEAVALLAEDVPSVRLWLSGQGDVSGLLDAAPDAARDRTEVLPLGGPRDQGRRYASAWVTALPSENDSFGLVVVESLAAGTPVVTTDHAAPPEVVEPGIGVVCRAGDATSLADALGEGLRLAHEAGVVTRCRGAAARYDWDLAIAPLLEKLYTT